MIKIVHKQKKKHVYKYILKTCNERNYSKINKMLKNCVIFKCKEIIKTIIQALGLNTGHMYYCL